MRNLVFSLLILPICLNAQKPDSLFMKFMDYRVMKNLQDNNFDIKSWEGESKITDLKFVNSVGEYLQVIDKGNSTFFLDEQLNRLDSIEYFLGLCGTVPHYELSIVKKGRKFIVMEDETFYDHENKNPAKKIATIAKSKIDSIFFINREREFKFNENYGVGLFAKSDPRSVLFAKKGKYGILNSNDEFLYDNIYLKDNLLEVHLNGLVGYHSITNPKYKSIKAFNHHLAEFVLPNGQKGFIDAMGNEYTNN